MSATQKIKESQAQQVSGLSLLDEIMEQTRITPQDEGYDIAKKGVTAFIENILATSDADEPINKSIVDRMLVELDRKISGQMDEIMHNVTFQEMESSWRSLKLLVDRTDFRENIKIQMNF